jgi:signal transduction histidine kinase
LRLFLGKFGRRLFIPLALAIAVGLFVGTWWKEGTWSLTSRTIAVALVATFMFSLLERWPSGLPAWLARWALQIVAVAVAVPLTTYVIWTVSTKSGAPPFWQEVRRFEGFRLITVLGVLVSPWIALAALVRQKDALARHQALSFALERSELERQALDARLSLLRAQVAPHFLFNTLANVQALVDAGSPRAAEVLRTLVAYLRAAVPVLHDSATTLEAELRLTRAYLELMHMRMPDRLRFEVRVDDEALPLRCPPTTLLTLIENAVRHGIDPSEEGGSIELCVRRSDERCIVRVCNTGAGLRESNNGLGTGLSTLRERLRLMFGGEAELQVRAERDGSVRAEIKFPACV